MKTSTVNLLLLTAAVGGVAWLVRKGGSAAAAVSSAQQAAASSVADFAGDLFGQFPDDINTTPPDVVVAGNKFAQDVFVVDHQGNYSQVVSYDDAAQLVDQGYRWGQNPATHTYDRIFPPLT